MQDIFLWKGDNFPLAISFKNNGEETDFVDGDTVTFIVKKSLGVSQNAVISLPVTSFLSGIAYVEILPDHTSNLDAGFYVYYIELLTSLGKKYTSKATGVLRLMEK